MNLISLGILLCLAIDQTHTKSQKKNLTKFPNKFKFGVSTTAYQVEGAWNVGGKGESIWDHAVHTETHRIKNRHNGDEACDSYHLYDRDVEMLRELDVDFYRFSISWPRILPTGFADHISTNGVAYYNNLINELVKYNITPVVMMYSWDLPQSLQDLGGWVNPSIEFWFKNYAEVLFEKFGDRVKSWVTVNSPDAICHEGYGEGKLAPFLDSSGVGEYHCSFNLLKSHAAVYNLYKEDFKNKQNGSVGISIEIKWPEALTMSHDDAEAVEDYKLFEHGMYLNPIFKGDFPSKVKERIAKRSMEQGYKTSRLPKFTPEEVKRIKGTADFISLNYYTTVSIYRNSSLEGKYETPSWLDDFGGGMYYNRKYRSAATEWLKVNPSGIRKVLNYIKDEYNNPEILIVENGYSTREGLKDDRRIQYIRNHLAQVLKAVSEDRINVSGYAVFSLMDNFEWTDGYDIRFGLYEVDYRDEHKERIARKSALFYKEIIRSRVIDYRFSPIYHAVAKKKNQVQYFSELVSSTGLNMGDKEVRKLALWMRKKLLLPLIKNVKKNGTVDKPNISVTMRGREWVTSKLDPKLTSSNITNKVNDKQNKHISNISNTNNTLFNATISKKGDTRKQSSPNIPKFSNTNNTQKQKEPISEYIPTISIKNNTRGQNRTDSPKVVLESSVNITKLERVSVTNSTNKWLETKSEHVQNVSSTKIQKQTKSKSEDFQTISKKNSTGEQNGNDSHRVLESYINKTQSERVLVINSTNEWQEAKLDHVSTVSNTNNAPKRNISKPEYVQTISKPNTTDSNNVLEMSVNKTQLERLPSSLMINGANVVIANATHIGEEKNLKYLLDVTFTNSPYRENKTDLQHPHSATNSTETENLPNFSMTNRSLALNRTKLGPKVDLSRTNQTKSHGLHNISVTNGTFLSNRTKSDKLPEITFSNVTQNLNKNSSEPVWKVSILNATYLHNKTQTER